MEIKVVFSNKNFLIIEKPSGLSVHNATQNELDLQKILESQEQKKIFFVHRLDKETSGLMIVALSSEMAKSFVKMFENHSVRKRYQALVKGELKESIGQWSWALSDKAEGRKNPQGVAAQRKPSITKYKIINSNKFFTLIECDLISGRQHQIRRHAALAGHPVVGDCRYGENKYNEKIFELYQIERLMLHSSSIEFEMNKERISVTSEIPQEFELMINLRQKIS